MSQQVVQRGQRIDRQVGGGKSRLGGIGGGTEEGCNAEFGGAGRHGENASGRSQGAVQRQFPDERRPFGQRENGIVGPQDRQQDRQVVERTLLAGVGGCKVDDDVTAGEFAAAGTGGCLHALA